MYDIKVPGRPCLVSDHYIERPVYIDGYNRLGTVSGGMGCVMFAIVRVLHALYEYRIACLNGARVGCYIHVRTLPAQASMEIYKSVPSGCPMRTTEAVQREAFIYIYSDAAAVQCSHICVGYVTTEDRTRQEYQCYAAVTRILAVCRVLSVVGITPDLHPLPHRYFIRFRELRSRRPAAVQAAGEAPCMTYNSGKVTCKPTFLFTDRHMLSELCSLSFCSHYIQDV